MFKHRLKKSPWGGFNLKKVTTKQLESELNARKAISKRDASDKHIKSFKGWLADQGIDPESLLGKELVRQTKLIYTIEEKTRHLKAPH